LLDPTEKLLDCPSVYVELGDLARACRAGKLTMEHGDQPVTRAQSQHPAIGSVLANRTIEDIPGNPLQQIMKNATVMAHGVALLRV
jgi:hypothetical protein